jgi:tRNA threonylcarbamoyladenosine biosynthesis protein TsaE
VYHVDLYRVGDFRDLETLGLEDFLTEQAVVIVEWPEKFTLTTEWPIVRIQLEHVAEDTRRISVRDDAGVLGLFEEGHAPRSHSPII